MIEATPNHALERTSDQPTIAFFKESAATSGIPYQTLINLYLRDCAKRGKRLSLEWRASA